MRLLLIGSLAIVLSLFGVGIPSASARVATQLQEHNSYSGCFCQFGYGGSCANSVACASEGGRCVRACVITDQSEQSK